MDPGAPLRVLLVSYHFPPMSTTGSLRAARFCKYLPADVTVEVLTVADPPEPTGNRALHDEIVERVTIHKAPLPARGTQRWVGRVFAHAPFGSLLTKLLRTFMTLFRWVPDWQITWNDEAARVGAAVLAARPFDAIVATSPPHSSQLLGLRLSRASGVPLVCDFRDPWTGNPQRAAHHGRRWHLERRREAEVLAHAALVIANTPGNRTSLLAQFPRLDADKLVVLPNGYDPERRRALREGGPAPARRSGRRVVLYTGHLYDGGESVLRALVLLLAEDPSLPERVVFRFVGSLDPDIGALASELQPSGLVEMAGFLSADRVPDELRAADALLYVVPPAGVHWIPSKLYDYMLAGRPVLGVLPRGDAWDWLERTGLATLVEDRGAQAVREALAAFLQALARGTLAVAPDEAFIARFDARTQSAELARLLRRVAHGGRA